MHRGLILGASSPLGGALARALHARGVGVRALRGWRDREDPLGDDAPDIDWVVGERDNTDALRRAVAGCDVVWIVHDVWPAPSARFADAVRGPLKALRATLDVLRTVTLSRVVYVSSAATLRPGGPGERLTEEDIALPSAAMPTLPRVAYTLEHELLKHAALGFPAVVLNPALMLGPGAPLPHGSAWLRDLTQGRVRVTPARPISVVDVRDVAAAAISAATRTQPGARTLLAAHDLTVPTLAAHACALTHTTPPPALPAALAAPALRLSARGLHPSVAHLLYHGAHCAHGRALRALSWQPRPLDVTLRDSLGR